MSIQLIEQTPSAYSYPLLVKQMIPRPMPGGTERNIVHMDGSRHSYAGFRERVSRLASALTSLGVTEGDTIGVMDVNSHRFLEVLFTIPMMGCILHPINTGRASETTAKIINHAGDIILMVHADELKTLAAVREKIRPGIRIIVMTDDETLPEDFDPSDEYETLLAEGRPDFVFPDFDENAAALLVYTTGSLGDPKGVLFSHRHLTLHSYGLMSAYCALRTRPVLGPCDAFMPLTPLYHVHAWGFPYLLTLLGAKQVFPGRKSPEALIRMISEENVTCITSDPAGLHALMESPAFDRAELRDLKVIVGGAPLSEEVCRAALKKGINICAQYGMTETGPLLTASALRPEMQELDIGEQMRIRACAGFPAPLVDLKLVDIEGKNIPLDGEGTGEIVVRAPWAAQGYFKDPENSRGLWRDGWLYTGDIGMVDAHGCLKITDRIRDAVRSGSEWIDTREIEDVFLEHEAVQEAVVISVRDRRKGEKPLAFVVLKPGFETRIEEQDLLSFCRDYADKGVIPSAGIPEKIIFVDTIPQTSLGKISKRLMRDPGETLDFDLSKGP